MKPHRNIRYSTRYDAYYDEDTNLWCSPRCSDKGCDYCMFRPPTPVTYSSNSVVAEFVAAHPNEDEMRAGEPRGIQTRPDPTVPENSASQARKARRAAERAAKKRGRFSNG